MKLYSSNENYNQLDWKINEIYKLLGDKENRGE